MTAGRDRARPPWSGARAWFQSLLNRGSGAHLEPPTARGRSVGQYQPLYEYLRDRHANRVVLRFAEVESLVGFALPAAARAAAGWWCDDNAVAGNAWKLADRSVTVNLLAQVVVYERYDPPHRARRTP